LERAEAAYYMPIGIILMYETYENGNGCRKKVKSRKIEPSRGYFDPEQLMAPSFLRSISSFG